MGRSRHLRRVLAAGVVASVSLTWGAGVAFANDAPDIDQSNNASVSQTPSCYEEIPSSWESGPSECTGAHWASASEVLDRDQAGEIQLIFPTRRTLERLAQHASFDDIIADALAHPIEPISPWLDEVDGERFISIPEGIVTLAQASITLRTVC